MIKRVKSKLLWEGIIKPKHQKGKKCILMYHGVDLHENRKYNGRFFSLKNFEAQINYFKKNYNVIPLTDFFENKNLDNNKLNIAITFDDGYLNNLKYALPILEKYEIHATFFITGLNNNNEEILWADLVDICTPYIPSINISFNGRIFKKNEKGKFNDLKNYIKSNRFIGTPLFNELKHVLLSKSNINLHKKELIDYWQLLNPNQIRLMSKSKFATIGSHGFYHNNLGNIELSEALNELIKSKNFLENLTQYEINSIGFPDGSYTSELIKEAYSIGYKYQCTVSYNTDFDKSIEYLENRLGLYPITSVPYINYQIQTFAKENNK